MDKQPAWDIAVGDKTIEVETLNRVGRFGFGLLTSTTNPFEAYREWVRVSSEAEIRGVAVANYENVPQLMDSYWDVSTMFAIRRNPQTAATELKIILPSPKIPENSFVPPCAKKLLNLISQIESENIRREVVPEYLLEENPRSLGSLSQGFGIGIKWDEISGEGVYSRPLTEWFERGKDGELVGLNKGMTREQAKRCPLVLVKLQHPDYVGGAFASSLDEVDEIIEKTFFVGEREYGLKLMMGQYLPIESNSLTWNLFRVDPVEKGAGSRGNFRGSSPFYRREICFPFYREGGPRKTPIENARERLEKLLSNLANH